MTRSESFSHSGPGELINNGKLCLAELHCKKLSIMSERNGDYMKTHFCILLSNYHIHQCSEINIWHHIWITTIEKF